MLNKKLVLGSLVAGAFLLPMAANAGVVNGPCVLCHTMHATDGDGVNNATQNNQLLLGAGCLQCHAYTTNDTDGLATGTGIPAPQVISGATNPTAGGSFYDVGGNDAQQHNVPTVSVNDTDLTLGNVPPGSAVAVALDCATCHGGSGGHHGTLSKTAGRTGASPTNTYRQLYNGGVGVAVTGGHVNYNVNDTGTLQYETGTGNNINAFCATCHGTFHGAGQGAAGAWIRHPTDYGLTEAGGTYSLDYNTNVTGTDAVIIPVGVGATDSQDVLCVTCHRPHGSAYPDLLRFNYAPNLAGDTTTAFGCESCHGAK